MPEHWSCNSYAQLFVFFGMYTALLFVLVMDNCLLIFSQLTQACTYWPLSCRCYARLQHSIYRSEADTVTEILIMELSWRRWTDNAGEKCREFPTKRWSSLLRISVLKFLKAHKQLTSVWRRWEVKELLLVQWVWKGWHWGSWTRGTDTQVKGTVAYLRVTESTWLPAGSKNRVTYQKKIYNSS